MLNVILKKVIFRSGHNSKHQIKIRPYFKTDMFDCAQISFEIRHLLSPHINNKQNENNGEEVDRRRALEIYYKKRYL